MTEPFSSSQLEQLRQMLTSITQRLDSLSTDFAEIKAARLYKSTPTPSDFTSPPVPNQTPKSNSACRQFDGTPPPSDTALFRAPKQQTETTTKPNPRSPQPNTPDSYSARGDSKMPPPPLTPLESRSYSHKLGLFGTATSSFARGLTATPLWPPAVNPSPAPPPKPPDLVSAAVFGRVMETTVLMYAIPVSPTGMPFSVLLPLKLVQVLATPPPRKPPDSGSSAKNLPEPKPPDNQSRRRQIAKAGVAELRFTCGGAWANPPPSRPQPKPPEEVSATLSPYSVFVYDPGGTTVVNNKWSFRFCSDFWKHSLPSLFWFCAQSIQSKRCLFSASNISSNEPRVPCAAAQARFAPLDRDRLIVDHSPPSDLHPVPKMQSQPLVNIAIHKNLLQPITASHVSSYRSQHSNEMWLTPSRSQEVGCQLFPLIVMINTPPADWKRLCFPNSVFFWKTVPLQRLFRIQFPHDHLSNISVCGALLNAHCGRLNHGLVLKDGLDSNIYVVNALMYMYAECGFNGGAVFIRVEVRQRWEINTHVGGVIKLPFSHPNQQLCVPTCGTAHVPFHLSFVYAEHWKLVDTLYAKCFLQMDLLSNVMGTYTLLIVLQIQHTSFDPWKMLRGFPVPKITHTLVLEDKDILMGVGMMGSSPLMNPMTKGPRGTWPSPSIWVIITSHSGDGCKREMGRYLEPSIIPCSRFVILLELLAGSVIPGGCNDILLYVRNGSAI